MQPTFPICSQCGFSHPVLKEGERCPMAKEKTNSGEEIPFEWFFNSLRDILRSQIQQKNIKDGKKFLARVLIQITKEVETYNE